MILTNLILNQLLIHLNIYMYNISNPIAKVAQVPLIPTLSVVVGVLLITYVGLLAFIMTYGAIQMQSAEALRDTRAHVATLDTKYFNMIASINQTDPTTLGFVKQRNIAYVTNIPISVSMRTQ